MKASLGHGAIEGIDMMISPLHLCQLNDLIRLLKIS